MLTIITTRILIFLALTSFKVDTHLSSVTIDGTSTLHDWEMNVEKISTSGSITEEEGVYTTSNLSFTFPVAGLESGKDAMNTNTYKAMSYENYPNVTFSNIQLESNASKYLAKGDLTITGTKKNISIPVSISNVENERVLIKGSYTMKMSSFGVEPPEVMWGTITTGDEVTIQFNIIIVKS